MRTFLTENRDALAGKKLGLIFCYRGGGADKAGLQERDVILEVNGTKVGTMNKMYSLLVSFKSGDTVHVKYLRNGQQHETDVVLMTAAELDSLGE